MLRERVHWSTTFSRERRAYGGTAEQQHVHAACLSFPPSEFLYAPRYRKIVLGACCVVSQGQILNVILYLVLVTHVFHMARPMYILLVINIWSLSGGTIAWI